MKKVCIIIGILFYCIFTVQAQLQERVSVVDSTSLIVYSQFEFSYNFPLADLRTDYHNFMSVGTGVDVKTDKNFIFGFHFNYQFGGKVRGEILNESFKELIAKGTNYFIDQKGVANNELSVDYRGLYFNFVFGKIFPVSKYYRNSGIIVEGGVGVLQHYMHITNPNNAILSLKGEYSKGYDKLTLGFSLYQFIGYQHITKRNLLCFYGGIEFSEIFSKRQRQYDFNLMKKDDNSYFESFIGLKFGWIIPLYKHNPHRIFQSRF